MVQLVVVFMDDSIGYFSDFNSWCIKSRDGVSRIVLRQGGEEIPSLPRTVIPLNNVRYYTVERLDHHG